MSFECGQQRVMRLGWERPGSPAFRRVLTNRMREFFTYGSVGGAGGNPGSYPAPNDEEAALGNEAIMNIPLSSFSAVPPRRGGTAEKDERLGLGLVTQGGSRCAPLPWAIFSLPLRGGRRSLLGRL